MSVAILDDTKSELGEGPTYDRIMDTAWWFDIEGRVLFEHRFEQNNTTQHGLPGKASMLGVVDEATALIAMEDGLYVRDTKTGDPVLHQSLEADNPETRSNDGRVHSSGALWIGTMGHRAERGVGAIYHFLSGKLTKLYPQITIPNAICFSPDGATAYFTDTMENVIKCVAIDPANGLPTGEPEPFFDQNELKGGLDGAITDADGNLWVAVWGASCLQKINSRGELIEVIALPATQPSCPCFIGPNLDRLLVTTAWQGNREARTKGNGGKTLVVDMPVRGKPEPRISL